MKRFVLIFAFIVSLSVVGTIAGEEFRFPGGNSDRGKVTFVNLNCVQCHHVKGVKLDPPKTKRRLNLSLGAEIRFVKKYEDLIMAIANPKHVITKQYAEFLTGVEVDPEINAFMTDFSEEMSVQQLMDLVVFLDKVYRENLDDYGTVSN